MDGFSRSTTSFRRQGSSGLVWDDKFLQNEIRKVEEERSSGISSSNTATAANTDMPSSSSTTTSNGGLKVNTYRTTKVSQPSMEPPSPKVSGCGFCNAFAKPTHHKKPNKRKSR
ncbi:hypothetical protein ACFE04_003709 [Oxalis oulophora]